ncbi:MAG: pilus assembly protein TadG-related protein [Pseudomonadota bacterium]
MSLRLFIRDRAGGITPFSLVCMIALVAIGGLATDAANAYRMRAMMQATADAAALAAAADLPDQAAARASALQYVEANMARSAHGELLRTVDIVFGRLDEKDGKIVVGAQTNAVEVKLVREGARGNALPTFLTRIIGQSSWSLSTSAVAIGIDTQCPGILANGHVKMGHTPKIGARVCVYGRESLQVGHDLVAEPAARVGTENLDNIKLKKNASLPDGVLFEADFTAKRAEAIAEIIDYWVGESGDGTDGTPPNGWSVVGPLEELPDTLAPATIYHIDGDLTISQDYTVSDVILAVDGNVRWGQDGRFTNTRSCDNGEAIGLYATGDIRIGHDPVGRGIDMIAGGTVRIGHDIGSSEMLIEAAGDIDFGHDPTYTNTCRPLFSLEKSAKLRG